MFVCSPTCTAHACVGKQGPKQSEQLFSLHVQLGAIVRRKQEILAAAESAPNRLSKVRGGAGRRSERAGERVGVGCNASDTPWMHAP